MSRLLPPHISDELPNMEKSLSSEFNPTRLGFPNEFPYEFESPAFSPGFTSPGDSTETEDESSDDEKDFLAGLTRRLAPSTHRIPPSFPTKSEGKREVAATSPQSTLSGLGSFSNSGSRSPVFPSPQATSTTSFRRDNAWDVISAAAGEVARLKLGSYEPVHLPLQSHESLLRLQNRALHAEKCLQQRLIDQMLLCSSQPRIRVSENHHFPKRVMNEEVAFQIPNPRYMRNHKNVLSNPSLVSPQLAGTPLKRPSAGTGVFLPRRYPTTSPSDSLKKTVNNIPTLQPKVNAHNLNSVQFNNVAVPRLSQFDYGNYNLPLQGRQGDLRGVGGSCLTQERHLPQDWMY